MKCIIDPDLLFPPPIPGTLHFEEMVLHQQQLARLDLKVTLSPELMEILWEQWQKVRQKWHKEFLQKILTRHLAISFPEELVMQSHQVTLMPDCWAELNENCRAEWLRSVVACYAVPDFNNDGAVLATWRRDEFIGKQCLRLCYANIQADLSLKRDEAEWVELEQMFAHPPLQYNRALRVYADESGNDGRHEWIALVVISEADANRIVASMLADFNKSWRANQSKLSELHISKHLKSEQERRFVVCRIVQELCSIEAACFVVPRQTKESENDLYARGISATLCYWQDLIAPVYIDTPYDRANDHRKNLDLGHCIHNAVQKTGKDYRSDDVILGKAHDYPGLGIADVVAYLYFRRQESDWNGLWQQLNNKKCFVL